MKKQTQIEITEEELRRVFADTLDKGASCSAIFVVYYDGGTSDDGSKLPNLEVGIPYDIIDGKLEVGPYLKNIFKPSPRDYHERKKQIPIKDILKYKRLELSDILC